MKNVVVTTHGSCSGYTDRCCTGPLCSVQNGDGLCYCDANCHTRDECCSDVGCQSKDNDNDDNLL